MPKGNGFPASSSSFLSSFHPCSSCRCPGPPPRRRRRRSQCLTPVSAEEGREVTLPASEEDIDKEIARLQTRLQEIRSRASSSAGEGIPREGNGLGAAFPEEVAEWQRLTFETVYLLENHLNSLQDLKEIRKANRERTTERNEWKGFTERPPYPVSFLEDLYATIRDKQFEKQMAEVKRKITEGGLRESLRNLEKAGKDLRDAEEHIVSGPEGEPKVRAIWLRDLAKRRYEMAEVGALSLETQRLVLDEDLGGKAGLSPVSRTPIPARRVRVSPFQCGPGTEASGVKGSGEIPERPVDPRTGGRGGGAPGPGKGSGCAARAQESVLPGREPAKEQRETLDHLKSAPGGGKSLPRHGPTESGYNQGDAPPVDRRTKDLGKPVPAGRKKRSAGDPQTVRREPADAGTYPPLEKQPGGRPGQAGLHGQRATGETFVRGAVERGRAGDTNVRHRVCGPRRSCTGRP